MERHANAAHPLRQAREAARLSSLDLAYKSKVSQRTIERIEDGGITTPRYATLKVLADVLDVDPGQLVPEGQRAA